MTLKTMLHNNDENGNHCDDENVRVDYHYAHGHHGGHNDRLAVLRHESVRHACKAEVVRIGCHTNSKKALQSTKDLKSIRTRLLY